MTDSTLKDPEEYLADKLESLNNRVEDQTVEEEQKDNIFKEMYIPRSVAELSMEDIYRMQREGTKEDLDKFAKMANFEST